MKVDPTYNNMNDRTQHTLSFRIIDNKKANSRTTIVLSQSKTINTYRIRISIELFNNYNFNSRIDSIEHYLIHRYLDSAIYLFFKVLDRPEHNPKLSNFVNIRNRRTNNKEIKFYHKLIGNSTTFNSANNTNERLEN